MKIRLAILVVMLTISLHFVSSSQTYYTIQNKGTESAYKYNTLGDTINGWASGMPDTLLETKPLPFIWQFYGKTVSSFKISDNGYITFDAGETKSNPNNESLPSLTAPKKSIFAFWDNLVLYKPNAFNYLIHTWTYGTAPNRVFVIAWLQTSKEDAGTTDSRFTFCIRLYESGLKKFDVVLDNYYNDGTAASTSGTIGCQNGDGTIGTMVTGSPDYAFPTNLSDAATDDVVFEFYYGTQLPYDMTVTSVNLPNYVKTGTSIPIKGKLRNLGSKTITSLKLNYSVDGSTPVSQTINSLNISTGEYYSYTHPTDWTVPATEKEYSVEVWASELNGNVDGNMSNDKHTVIVSALNNLVPRKPLHEEFTSSTCAPCKPGNEQLESVLAQYPDKWTCVKYQYNFPVGGDPYYTSECAGRSAFYGGINSIPRLEIDGTWNNNPWAYFTSVFDQYYAVPCFVNITANAVIKDQSVDLKGSVTPYANIIGTIKLFIAVVEKVTTKNKKSNGETEFHYVMKKMLPDANGVTVSPITKDSPIPINQNYTFPGTYKLPPDANSPIDLTVEHSVEEFTDLTVVIWLQNDDTKEIYQSEFASVLNSVGELTDNFLVNLYPNPVITMGKIRFNLDKPELVSFEIVNNFGQKIYSNTPAIFQSGTQTMDFDATTLLSGVYYMELYLGDKIITRTFVK